jgi:DNA-binding transcriptional ArsR family regulator
VRRDGSAIQQLGLAQPQASKHLRVLREVGALRARAAGRRRLYRLNGPALKPIHDRPESYERTWARRLDRLDVLLDDAEREEEGDRR